MALDFTAETIIVRSKDFQIWVKRNFDFYSYWLHYGCPFMIVFMADQYLKFPAQSN